MDLTQFDTSDLANAGYFVHLKHPVELTPLYHDDDPDQPVGVRVLGTESDKYKEISDAISKRASLRMVKARGNEEKMVDIDAVRNENIMRLAQTTVEIQYIEIDGNLLDSTVKDAQLLYERMPWVREQV